MNAFLQTTVRRLLSLPVVTLLATAALQAQPSRVKLPDNAKGAAAIAALGEHLPAVAKAYGLEARGLRDLLETQPNLAVDVDGALLFLCEGLAVDIPKPHGKGKKDDDLEDAITATSSTSALLTGSSVDALQLHSLPGASRVLYLDFDGHTTSGTSWNSSFAGGATIVSQPFDLDGDPTTFNAAERSLILAIWKRVAEDYAPFAIDVTTQDPGVEALRKTTSSDNAYGVRVVISPTNWYNAGAGGVAYVGSFSWNTDTPCFIFSNQLANGEKYMAEAIAHEAGHTLGLYHDGAGGSSPTEYYYGQGNWAPIMGVGYYKPITQFSKGDYANATNLQDDYAVISTHAPLAADDHGNTLATATTLSVPEIASGGTIEHRADLDVFRFDTGAGVVSFNIRSLAPEPNLDIQAELLDSAGRVLQVSDPATLDAALNATLAAGTYYLRISGVGVGDPKIDGYPAYGSVGNYVITGAVVPISGRQAPTARASATNTSGSGPLTVSFNGNASSDPDGAIVGYRWDFGNGDSSTAANPTYIYTSPGFFTAVLTVTDNDGLVGTASVTINVIAPPNQPPVAAATSNTSSGSAPLPIVFSAAGSFDPDGNPLTYAWDFGDGTSSNAMSPSKTYSSPGNYTARLTVTDNLGASASAAVAVSVAANRNADFDVRQFSLTSAVVSGGADVAKATVLVCDRLGNAVSGVTVTVQWSGLVNGSTTEKTGANGLAVLTSRSSKKGGTITAQISSVTGGTYDPAIYSEPLTRSVLIR
jgi:PKD repeat protein